MTMPFVGRGITEYSQCENGEVGNHDRVVQFDATDGFIGITAWDAGDGRVKDRVLLSPRQFAALVNFVNAAKRHQKKTR